MVRNKIRSSSPLSAKSHDLWSFLYQLGVPRDLVRENCPGELRPNPDSCLLSPPETGKGHSADRARSAKSKPEECFIFQASHARGFKTANSLELVEMCP